MGKARPRNRAKRSSGGGSGAKGGGTMMSMRAGFKGIASSVSGNQSTTSKATQKVVNVFWYLVYAAVAILIAMMLYKRFTR